MQTNISYKNIMEERNDEKNWIICLKRTKMLRVKMAEEVILGKKLTLAKLIMTTKESKEPQRT